MKHKYRNILIGTAIATILGATGAAFAHGGVYGGNMQQGAQVQPGCGGNAAGTGMMGGMKHGMGPGAMMGGMQHGMGPGAMMGGMHHGMGQGGMMGGMHQGMGPGGMMGGMHHGMGQGGMMGGMHQGMGPGGMMGGMHQGMGPGAMMGGMHHGMGPGAMMGGMQHGMGQGGMMGGMQHGMGPGAIMGRMGSAFDLSAEQQAEMSKIRDEMLPLMGELHGKMQANHEQMRALQQVGNADQAAIDKLADQKGDLVAEMIKFRSQLQARMQSVLSDEQREQMRQHRQGMGMGMMGG